MMTLVLVCLLLLLACIGATLYRLVVAPDAVNRLLAFDLLGVLVSLSLALVAIIEGSWVYLEISMGLAVLALVATVAIAHFIERGRIF